MATEFSTSAMEDIIKEKGDKRVSLDASDELDSIVENIVEEAVGRAEEDDRKTVRSEDIKEAVRS